MAIIELEQVTYNYRSRYQQVDALKGVSYSFQPGKLYALVGKSGSGKSTLLSLMAGLDVPQGGRVLYEGQSTKEMNLTRYRREKAAVIYQSFRLFPLLTVGENITYPMELRKMPAKTAKARVAELLEKVKLPDSVANRFPSMLSGGEQQRVAIARALGMETKLLLADEPTGNLDSENSLHIVELLRNLAHQDGYCVIMVTHDMEIAALADHVLTMRDGKLQE